jgi:hypothetical protein
MSRCGPNAAQPDSGPYLFGGPTLADAFAPIAVRLRTYR